VGSGKVPEPTFEAQNEEKLDSVNLTESINGQEKRTRDVAAAAAGMSPRTYTKAKAVIEAAEREPEKYREIAEEMDRTGNVDRAYGKLERKKDPKPKREPDDLVIVISNWTVQMEHWIEQLNQVLPYKNYVEGVPKIAEGFRKAAAELIGVLGKFMNGSEMVAEELARDSQPSEPSAEPYAYRRTPGQMTLIGYGLDAVLFLANEGLNREQLTALKAVVDTMLGSKEGEDFIRRVITLTKDDLKKLQTWINEKLKSKPKP
jgi:hypothetical protein